MNGGVVTEPTFALVIQGPLSSPGKGGSSFGSRIAGDVRSDEIVEFDCSDNIRAIIDESREMFGERIVLATWANAAPFEHPGAVILRLDDKENDAGSRRGAAHLPYNIFRSYQSGKAGVREAARRWQPDFIIRMRTDQRIDLAAIIAFLRHTAADAASVYVPGINLPYFGAMDFYFAARTKAMLGFYERLMPGDERFFCNTNVHLDIVLKNALGHAVDGECQFLFPRSSKPATYPKPTARMLCEAVQNIVRPLPASILQEMVWRGEGVEPANFKNARPKKLFAGDPVPQLVDRAAKGPLATMLGIDWERYAEGMQALGRDNDLSLAARARARAVAVVRRARRFA